MKVLFFPLTADGHVNPILPLARELLSRGEEVVFYATAEYETVVRNIGASFRRIDSRLHSPLNLATQQAGGGKEPNPKQLMPLILEQMLHGMREAPTMAEQVRTEQADCIVYDTMSSWGRTVAGLVRVPAVAFHATYAMRRNSPLQRQMSKNMGAPPLRAVLTLLRMVWTARQLQRHHGFPRMPMGELMNASEGLNIVPIPRRFQPDADFFDERFLFVGPSMPPRNDQGDFPLEQLDGKPVLLISLGTTVMNQRPDFYKACFEAFRDSRWQVVMACGKWIDPASLGPTPSNFIVRQRVPQIDVLQRARVFLTHAGMNSTMEGLWHGVPLAVFPLMFDQLLNASRVAELGLGLQLTPADSTQPKVLRDLVERLDTDAGYRERVSEFRTALQEAGGPRRAADALQQYVAARRGQAAS